MWTQLTICLMMAAMAIECATALLDESMSFKDCRSIVNGINTIQKFNLFAEEVIKFVDSNKWPKENIDKCLRSTDGDSDIRELYKIVKLANEVHSVCEPDFINLLVSFHRQMKANATYGKHLRLKKANGLSYFFHLFAVQVALICKRSALNKLYNIEYNNIEFAKSFKLIEESAKRDVPIGFGSCQELWSPPQRLMMHLISGIKPKIFHKMENIVLADSLKPSTDAEIAFTLTVNKREPLEEFMKTKKACKLIDKYGQSSIYPVARLAWLGYIAKDPDLDSRSTLQWLTQRWVKVVQYCQTVLIMKVRVDVTQEMPLKMAKELMEDKQMITLHIFNEKTKEKERIVEDEENAVEETYEPYRFPREERFNELKRNIKAYTHPKGILGWIIKHLRGTERSLVKYLTIKTKDAGYKKSLFRDYEDPENDVQFVDPGSILAIAILSPVLLLTAAFVLLSLAVIISGMFHCVVSLVKKPKGPNWFQ